MRIPREFETMCSKLHQDAPKPFASLESMIEYLTADFTPRQLSVIGSFIDELIRVGYDDAKLMRIWRQAGADVLISCENEGEIADFFLLIKSSIVRRLGAAR